MHLAILARDEQAAARDRGLGAGRGHVRVAVRPLQLESGQVGGGQATLLLTLETHVLRTVAPTVPARTSSRVTHGPGVRARIRLLHRVRRGRCECLAARVLGDGVPLRIAERCALRLHLAIRERVQNRARWKHPQELTRHGARIQRLAGICDRCLHDAEVAGRADPLEYCGA